MRNVEPPAGQLVDDSLVQCIRELRQMLGDTQHRLIRTVSRRGYLLDAEPRSSRSTQRVSLDFKPARVPPTILNKLFTETDAKRVAEIATRNQLPLPQIEFDTPDNDVPMSVRRFASAYG
jgi:DNA-binding winged helix-turn-helix (wHTH) protein